MDNPITPMKPPKMAKKHRKSAIPPEPKTPEEFNQQMEGFMMIVFGILKIANIDPSKLIAKAQADEFPAEL